MPITKISPSTLKIFVAYKKALKAYENKQISKEELIAEFERIQKQSEGELENDK